MISKLKKVSEEPAVVFINVAMLAEVQAVCNLCHAGSFHDACLPLQVHSWAVVSPNVMQRRYGMNRSKTKISSIM